ncbi:MAG TPA: ATP-binding protein [Spirochaetia bacterium]
MTSRNGGSPTPRLSADEILVRLRETRASGSIPSTVDSLSLPLAIVSEKRQLVYANTAFLELAGGRGLEQICGGRPGEVLGCINSGDGCGDGEQCRFCGAAQAILEALGQRVPSNRECHISVGPSESTTALDFSVQGVPFEINGHTYAMLTFTDISARKRRAGLERIFFHDIMNTASSFRLYLDLLRRSATDDRSTALIHRLSVICDTLEEEIEGQKILLSAESRTLSVQRELLESRGLVTQIVEQAGGWKIAERRTVRVAPFAESFTLISDDALLKRILGNMMKNALEATAEGGTVTLGCRKDGGGNALFHVHNPSFIPPEVQSGIFRRYFSTKGEGRGLGTWGMRLLAEDYLGGRITFTTSSDEGTTFLLSVPLRPPGFSTQASQRD